MTSNHIAISMRSNLNLPELSKDLQAPSGESIANVFIVFDVDGFIMTLHEPTTAASQRPPWIATTALHKASRPDEQAVSTLKLGPVVTKEVDVRQHRTPMFRYMCHKPEW